MRFKVCGKETSIDPNFQPRFLHPLLPEVGNEEQYRQFETATDRLIDFCRRLFPRTSAESINSSTYQDYLPKEFGGRGMHTMLQDRSLLEIKATEGIDLGRGEEK